MKKNRVLQGIAGIQLQEIVHIPKETLLYPLVQLRGFIFPNLISKFIDFFADIPYTMYCFPWKNTSAFWMKPMMQGFLLPPQNGCPILIPTHS